MPSWRRTGRWGSVAPRPSVHPSGRRLSRRWLRRVVRRRAQHVAGWSIGGAEALRGPQRQVRRGPGLAMFAVAHGVRLGW
jgi:hypothetical protein